MHIILAALGAIVTILILFNRLSEAGVDLGWLNPFSWHRRRKYRRNHDLNPVFKLASPLEVAALFIVGVGKVDGDLSATQKQEILNIFEQEFKRSASEAKALLASSVHLIGNGQEFFAAPARAVERVYDQLTAAQVISIKSLLKRVALIDGGATYEQEQFIAKVVKSLPSAETKDW